MRISQRVRCIVGATLLLCISSDARAYPPPTDPLTRIHYDLEVAGYCGLITAAVSAGFHHQLSMLKNSSPGDPKTLAKARSDAQIAVYREWQNRGLGGFRGWCRKEGVVAAARFTAN